MVYCNNIIYVLVTQKNNAPLVLKCRLINQEYCMCKCDCNSFGCGSRCDCNSFCCDNKCDCLIDNCNKIIKSVALQQTALSHILNAEGEKIQKIICSTDDVDEILKVNGSVNKTITQIISLEHILCSKLQIVKDLCLEDLPYKNSY